MYRRRIPAVIMLLLCVQPTIDAAIVEPSRAEFLIRYPGLVTEGFEDHFSNGPSVIFRTGTPEEFSITESGDSFNNIASTTSPSVVSQGLRSALMDNTHGDGTGPSIVTFAFVNPIRAFGVDVVDFGNAPPRIGEVLVENNASLRSVSVIDNFDGFLPGGNVAFVGVFDPQGFTEVSLTITTTGDSVGFDEVVFGNVMHESCLAGDFTGDGLVSTDDVAAFAQVLIDPCNASLEELCIADMNEDTLANGMDVRPFVDCVLGGHCP